MSAGRIKQDGLAEVLGDIFIAGYTMEEALARFEERQKQRKRERRAAREARAVR